MSPDSPKAAAVAAAVREAAAGAGSWPALVGRIAACTACPELARTRTSVVVGQAPPGAVLALLGEAPGAEEDATGLPFVGRSGQLLDALLEQAGGRRSEVAVLNVLKCRPPANRRPTAVESARCRGWLDRQLELLAPQLTVVLGGTAIEAVLGRGTKVTAVRGRFHEVAGRLVLPTYHPSAALRFGPAGEPRRLLTADLARAVATARVLGRLGLTFARATPADADPLLRLTRAAYGGLPALQPPSGALAEALGDVSGQLSDHGGVIARRDGAPVAGLRFGAGRLAGAAAPGRQWVRRVAVHPAAQRAGVGRALMTWAGAVARRDGYDEVGLGVRHGRPEALAFYRSLGYRIVREHETWTELRISLAAAP